MIRFFIYLALLTPLSVSAAEMSGQRLLEICLIDHPRCGAFVRETLRDWPDEVIDQRSLSETGRVVMYRCPKTYADSHIARLMVNNVRYYAMPVERLTAQQLTMQGFSRAVPVCAGSLGA